jgi:FMNH2-dependent dimethyl sulfone monooxygenase
MVTIYQKSAFLYLYKKGRTIDFVSVIICLLREGQYYMESLELGIFMPNIGKPFLSNMEMSTTWEWDYNKEIALKAEELGLDYLVPINNWLPFAKNKPEFSGYVLDPLPFAASLLAITKNISVFSTVYSSGINPYILARIGATLSQIGQGRWGVNIVSGNVEAQYRMAGLPWLEHDERYEVSRELIEILKGLWTENEFSYQGKHYSVQNGWLEPKPAPNSYPKIVQAGYSPAARELTAQYADIFFVNGASKQIAEIITDIEQRADSYKRKVKKMIACLCVWDQENSKAQEKYEQLIRQHDHESVEAVAKARMGSSFRTDLDVEGWVLGGSKAVVGTPEEIVDQFQSLHNQGIDIILLQFINFKEDLERFGIDVLPLIKEKLRYSFTPQS